ncbi:hypothetical protein [Amycolatopsis sp. NPDC001319]|uniref:hypothetical protein n=1 Tax=unclassified Amycolatopsis TaxID=2618356 RepID=UPI0036A5F254
MSRSHEAPPPTALVLGGGGPVGAAWMSALVHRLETAGLPLSGSGVVVGTSAGSIVGAWLTMEPAGLTAVPAKMRERAAWRARNVAAGQGDRALFQSLAQDTSEGPERARRIGRPRSPRCRRFRRSRPTSCGPGRCRPARGRAGSGSPR